MRSTFSFLSLIISFTNSAFLVSLLRSTSDLSKNFSTLVSLPFEKDARIEGASSDYHDFETFLQKVPFVHFLIFDPNCSNSSSKTNQQAPWTARDIRQSSFPNLQHSRGWTHPAWESPAEMPCHSCRLHRKLCKKKISTVWTSFIRTRFLWSYWKSSNLGIILTEP